MKQYRFLQPLRKVVWLLLVLFAGLILVFVSNRGPAVKQKPLLGVGVFVKKDADGYTLIRNGQPFTIKGASGSSMLKELSQSGGNTVFCWDTAALGGVLDQAFACNLAVIAGIDLPDPAGKDSYASARDDSALLRYSKRLVEKYRNHPALLFWCLGNELKFPLSPFKQQFYKTYNQLLLDIHQADSHHPVATTIINVNKKHVLNLQWRVPGIDLIGINCYNSLKKLRSELHALSPAWSGPFFVAEWAPEGGWEARYTKWYAPFEKTSHEKAAAFDSFYRRYMPLEDKRFLGSLAYYWGSREEYTHTWFSFFDEDGMATETVETLKDCWSGTRRVHQSPRLSGIRIDDEDASANVLLAAGTRHQAVVQPSQDSGLTYKWVILPESWTQWWIPWSHFVKPDPVRNLLMDSTGPLATFRAPLKTGGYRMFVTVFNSNRYCATANIPFYVTE